jgi:hypothetical protein
MPFRRRRHRPWIALVALFGLLFQQLAMAAYSCPLDRDATAAAAAASNPPCHQPNTTDNARCHEHCHPLTSSSDHSSPPTVPAAILPPTTWDRTASWQVVTRWNDIDREVVARATAPPLNIQHCTFQI